MYICVCVCTITEVLTFRFSFENIIDCKFFDIFIFIIVIVTVFIFRFIFIIIRDFQPIHHFRVFVTIISGIYAIKVISVVSVSYFGNREW